MVRLTLRTLRYRMGGFVATFIALMVGAMIVMACGGLMETGIRAAIPAQRFAGADLVVTGDRHHDLTQSPNSHKDDDDNDTDNDSGARPRAAVDTRVRHGGRHGRTGCVVPGVRQRCGDFWPQLDVRGRCWTGRRSGAEGWPGGGVDRARRRHGGGLGPW
jgi:hypothetical protein